MSSYVKIPCLTEIPTPLLPVSWQFQSLFRNTSVEAHVAQGASTGEQQQKRWNKIFYINTRVPPFVWSVLLYLLSEVLLHYSLCSPERARRHVNAPTHTHAPPAHTHREETKVQEKEEETRFGTSLSVFLPPHYSVFRLPPPWRGTAESAATIRERCDTLLRPLCCTTPANMQAHLK